MELTNLPIAIAANMIGCGFTLAIIYAAGWTEKAYISSWSDAAQRLLTSHPEMTVRRGVVSCDGKCTLLQLKDEQQKQHLAVVVTTGCMLSARLISPEDTTASLDNDGLTLFFNSPAWKPVEVKLQQRDTKKWFDLFYQIKQT